MSTNDVSSTTAITTGQVLLLDSGSNADDGNYSGPLCRTRLTGKMPEPYLSPSQFNVDSCLKCLGYLRIPFTDPDPPFDPDPTVPEQLDRFCNEGKLNQNQCTRWQNCCKDAVNCCLQQIEAQTSLATNAVVTSPANCPQTWDGFSCVPETLAGDSAPVICPSFLLGPDTSNIHLEIVTRKVCFPNGQWLTNRNGSEFTDYNICKYEQQLWDYQVMLLKVICESISVFCLCFSIFLFLYCRKLYIRPRLAAKYKMHIYMFTAMLLYSASCLVAETLFYLSEPTEHFPKGCETIAIFIRFFMTFSFSAMSVEAFFLHWNLTDTYNPIVRPYTLMALGVAAPLIVNIVYVALRFTISAASPASDCWIDPWYPYVWILYGFNFAALLFNFVLLADLFRVILKMEKETPHYDKTGKRRNLLRQAMRKGDFRPMVTFTVIFGIPLVLIIISPPYKNTMYKIYQIISISAQMLQGTFASIALCFLSSEVYDAFTHTGLGGLLHLKRRPVRRQSEQANSSLLRRRSSEHRPNSRRLTTVF